MNGKWADGIGFLTSESLVSHWEFYGIGVGLY